jgi:molybdopterin converting factor subunit 1
LLRSIRALNELPSTLSNRETSAYFVSMTQPLTVLLFGITRDLVGQSRLSVPLADGGRVADLLTLLHDQYPALAGIKSVLVAVNSEYADPDTLLMPSDEIALIPPVSGG